MSRLLDYAHEKAHSHPAVSETSKVILDKPLFVCVDASEVKGDLSGSSVTPTWISPLGNTRLTGEQLQYSVLSMQNR